MSDQEALDPFVELLDGLAGRLHDVAAGIRLLAAEVAVDWADPRGREWTAHAELLHRDVDRQAEDSGGLAHRIADGISTAVGDGRISTAVGDGISTAFTDANGTSREEGPSTDASRPGPRLGGTDGERVPSVRGMRIGLLPES